MGLSIRILQLVVISACLALSAWRLHPDRNHFNLAHWRIAEITARELASLNSVPLLLDAREEEAFAQKHMPGAIHLSGQKWDDELPTFLGAWQPESPVVIYCNGQSCGASKLVALRLLNDLPAANIYVLKGGFPAWEAFQTSLGTSKL